MSFSFLLKWKPEAPPPGVADTTMTEAPAQIQRSHARLPVNYRFSIHANQPEAKQRSMIALGINMSKAGALVEAPEPLSAGTIVQLRAPELGLTGEATVRHCSVKGARFRIGLHFPNPLEHCL